MTKIRGYSKAIAALLGAIATFLVSVGAPPEWSAYASGAVAIITGIATFGIPNATTPAEVLSPVDQILTNIPAVIATAQQAVADVDRVKQAATDVLGNLPVFGPDAQAVLARFGL